jgi:hypothetical protein
MVRIENEVGGRRYSSPKQFTDALIAGIMEEVGDGIVKQLQNVRCSEHGQQPSVRVSARQKDKIDLQGSGCCDNLIREATAKLG